MAKPCKEQIPFGRFNQNVAQTVCGFQVALLKELIHLKITLLLWQTFPKSSTGVWISNRIASFNHSGMLLRKSELHLGPIS